MHIVLILDLGSLPPVSYMTLANSLNLSLTLLVGKNGPHAIVVTVK